VLTVLTYCAPYFFDLDYPLLTGLLRDPVTGDPQPRLVHYTLLLHTYVMLTLATMFNSRRLQTSQLSKAINPFNLFYRNAWLYATVLVALVMIYAGVGFALQSLLMTAQLTWPMHWTVFGLTIGAFLVQFLSKQSSDEFAESCQKLDRKCLNLIVPLKKDDDKESERRPAYPRNGSAMNLTGQSFLMIRNTSNSQFVS